MRFSSRVTQIKQEEGMDIAARELVHEKTVQSAIQMSQSWEDLTLVITHTQPITHKHEYTHGYVNTHTHSYTRPHTDTCAIHFCIGLLGTKSLMPRL